jgi:hypothetical protein
MEVVPLERLGQVRAFWVGNLTLHEPTARRRSCTGATRAGVEDQLGVVALAMNA